MLTYSRLSEVVVTTSHVLPMPGIARARLHWDFPYDRTLAFHESYHAGQMGYVRKLLGQSALAG